MVGAESSPILTKIVPSPEGLVLVGVRGVVPRLEGEAALPGARRVVVDLPGARLGEEVPREMEVDLGLVLRVRTVRYREGEETGVRVRVDLRGYPKVEAEDVPEGILVRVTGPPKAEAPPPEKRAARKPAPPGAFSALGTLSTSRTSGGSGATTLATELSGAQVIRDLFAIEGRLAYGESGGKQSLARYTFVARGFDLGSFNATAGAGDLLLRFSGLRGSVSAAAETLDVRGLALRLTSGRSVFELFEGSARGAPLLVRVGESYAISSGFSGDRVAGAVASLPLPSWNLSLGTGWAHTFAFTGPDRDNRFLEVGWKPSRSVEAGAHLSDVAGRRRDGSSLSGTLFGLGARVSLPGLDVDGTYRRTSRGYVAPGGNQEFAGEKGSSLYASARPLRNLTLRASASESESMPLGLLYDVTVASRSTGLGAAWLLGTTSAGIVYSRSRQESRGLPVNPIDSKTTSVGLSLDQKVLAGSISVGLSRDRTENATNPGLDLEATVGSLNTFWRVGDRLGVSANARYASSRRVATGERLPDYAAGLDLSGHERGLSLALGLFGARTPAGTALHSTETLGARLRVSGTLPGGLLLGSSANYTRVRLGNGEKLTDRGVTVSLRRLFTWGDGPTPGGAGSWDSGEPVSPVLALARVEGRVFLDLDLDGRWEPGEPGVPGVGIQAEHASAKSDAEGRYRLLVEPGRHTVRVLTPTVPFAYQLTEPESLPVEIGPRRTFRKDVALTGFGAVEGRIAPRRNGGPPTAEEARAGGYVGVNLERKGGGEERSVLADRVGSFRFANLPPGLYRVRVAEADIPESYALDGPSEREVEVRVGETATVTFELRKLSVRERLERRGGRRR